MKEYIVIIDPDETGGYWTEVPALPGCGSQGVHRSANGRIVDH